MFKKYLCNVTDLQDNDHLIFEINELKDEIIVFFCNEEKKIKIFSSICPHFGGNIIYKKNLSELSCKWHNWKFCVNTGKCLTYPIKGKLNPYNYKVAPKNLSKYDFLVENNSLYLIKDL